MIHSALFMALIAVGGDVGVEKTLPSGRQYILYNPGGTKLPLVLAFHGLGEPAADFQTDTDLNKTAKAGPFVVAYPKGIGLRWNAGPGCCGTDDDLTFVTELLKQLKSDVAYDEHKVYAVGLSNGGMFCYRLAAEFSPQFAAIGVVAGSMETPPAATTLATPVMHLHGTKDLVVPADAARGATGFTPACSLQKALDAWKLKNGATSTSAPLRLSGPPYQVDRTDSMDAAGKTVVSSIVIQDGGHLWPGYVSLTLGTTPRDLLGQTNSMIKANDLLWQFLQVHQRP
jgi:polyhydroxybutyrate depolymerase